MTCRAPTAAPLPGGGASICGLGTKRPLTRAEPHISRRWRARRCPRCGALPGEPCQKPSGRIQAVPHTARRALSREEQRELEQQPASAAARPHAAVAPATARRGRGERGQPVAAISATAAAQSPGAAPSAERDPTVSAATSADDPGEAGPGVVFGSPRAGVHSRPGEARVASSTTRAYTSDWRQFAQWATRRGLAVLPADAEACAAYLTELAGQGLRINTVRRRARVIEQAHHRASETNPISDPRVQHALERIAKAPRVDTSKKLPLVRAVLDQVIDHIDPATTSGLRDRALLLTGFTLGLRRAELAAITLGDLQLHPAGLNVTLRAPSGREPPTVLLVRREPADHCPVAALHAWIERASITHGPIARRVTRTGAVSSRLSPPSIALIIKLPVEAAGLDPTQFAGESVRSGHATQATLDQLTQARSPSHQTPS